MRRALGDGDKVVATIGGETHEFPPDKVTAQVVETATRGGDKYRYAVVVLDLSAGEFPERPVIPA